MATYLEGLTFGSQEALPETRAGFPLYAGSAHRFQEYQFKIKNRLRAVTTISVREGIEIPDDSAAIVASEGLLGGNFVEINPGGSLDYFAPGDEIEDTQGAVSLISLLVQFVAGSGGDSEE